MTENLQNSHKTAQLTDAFRIFNELSQNLSASYQGIEEQVAKLHQELAFAHSERLSSLEEKERLAIRLEQILAALPAAVIVLDVNGKIVNCNALAVQFLGEPLLGQSANRVMARSLTCMANNPHEGELCNGKRINITYSQLENSSGQIVLLSDVSEMRGLQDLLNQQKNLSAMGEMVASMAHQVRTPLATAILYASQLANFSVDHHKRQHFAEKILERLLYLERQVNDMLLFAKNGRLAMERFSLSKFLSRLQASFHESIGSKPIQLNIVRTIQGDEIIGNEHALRGALMNLLNNAVDAMAGSGQIELTVTELDEGGLRMALRDTGPGVVEELRRRIVEPFFTTKLNGTGLGLSVVDSVVKAHGGQLRIESAENGEGAIFSFTLPAKSRACKPLPGGFSGKNLNSMEILHESV